MGYYSVEDFEGPLCSNPICFHVSCWAIYYRLNNVEVRYTLKGDWDNG
jgi:hypothetical protein